jgi:hypothetical protein
VRLRTAERNVFRVRNGGVAGLRYAHGLDTDNRASWWEVLYVENCLSPRAPTPVVRTVTELETIALD